MFYGFIIIALAWLWQWQKTRHGRRSLEPWFLRLFALGLLVIVLDTFSFADWLTWINLITLIIVLSLIWRLRS